MNIVIAAAATVVVAIAVLVTKAAIRFRSAGIEMKPSEFLWRLIRGGGYQELSTTAMLRRLRSSDDSLLVDLREPGEFRRGHIKGAISSPFADFLKEVVVAGKYADAKERELILICDTGHMSRVAGAILAEDEGFTRVYSLAGGMRRWQRHQKMARRLRCCRVAA